MNSGNESVKIQKTKRPSVIQLAELACQLNQSNEDSVEDLVNRALQIWDASITALAIPSQFAKKESFTFEEIANTKLLPSIKKALKTVDSVKGVEKAIKNYLNTIINDYNVAMKERNISEGLSQSHRIALTSLRQKLLDTKILSKAELTLLQQFQMGRQKGRHKTSALEIRELLGGADVGLPGWKL